MALWGTRERALPRGRRAAIRARRVRALRTVLAVILLGSALTLVWYGTRLEALTISTVTVSGTRTLSAEALTVQVDTLLNGSYLLLVPKRFSYTYPEDALFTTLLEEPRIADVHIDRPMRTHLAISITEHEPHALWCADHAARAGCVFVSSDGTAFAEAPPLTGSVFRRYLAEGRTPEVGVTFVSADYLRATEEFARALAREHGMQVHAIVETRDGDVRYRLRGGGELIVTRDASIQEVFENLDSVLNADSFRHLAPDNFAYIDLRFGSKVFVKEFEVAPAAATLATTTEAVE